MIERDFYWQLDGAPRFEIRHEIADAFEDAEPPRRHHDAFKQFSHGVLNTHYHMLIVAETADAWK